MFNIAYCRPSSTKPGHSLLIQTSLCLNLNIDISENGKLLEEISSAFTAELDNIDSLYFVISSNNFIISGGKVANMKQLSGEMLQISGYLSNGRVCHLL